MAKCSECGFLAISNSVDRSFSEAPDHFRERGFLRHAPPSLETCGPACFIGMANLTDEFYSDERLSQVSAMEEKIKTILEKERLCDGFTPWIQGFHPKEHREMIFQEELRRAERRHANLSLAVAVLAAVITALSGFFGAYMTFMAASLEAEATKESGRWQVEALQKQTDAQLEMTKMQIEAQKEIAKMTPPPQIIVRMPPTPAR